MKYSLAIFLSVLASLPSATPCMNSTSSTSSTNLSCPASTATSPSKCYYGTDFPQVSEWVDFTCLSNLYKPTILDFDSSDEVDFILTAVQSFANSSNLDARIIFAIILQETGLTCDVREHSGDNGVSHGLMQVYEGPDCLGTSVGGCSSDQVSAMVGAGVGALQTCYQQFGHDYPKALRCYNSGCNSVDPVDLTKAGTGTPSYVSDVGNILCGRQPSWEAHSNCGFQPPAR